MRNKRLALDKRPPLRYQKKISARALDRIITVINILKLYQFWNRLLFSAMSWFKMWQERKKSVRALWRCTIYSNQDVGLLSGINNMIQDICPRLWSEPYNHSLQVYILDFYFFSCSNLSAQKDPPEKKKKKKKKKKKALKYSKVIKIHLRRLKTRWKRSKLHFTIRLHVNIFFKKNILTWRHIVKCS